jgi:hypothetical protein
MIFFDQVLQQVLQRGDGMNFAETAERIIKTEGCMFALAVANVAASSPSGSKIADLHEARAYLKEAIVKALEEAVHEVQRQGVAE